MPTVKLTSAFIERAAVEPGAKRTIYWDEGLPGFGLLVTESGHRSFTIQYRAGAGRGGTDRRMTIKGVLKFDDARREAKAILGRVAKGGDPLGDKRKAAVAAGTTLKAVAEDYLEREGVKLRTGGQRKATLKRLVFPVLGSRQIDTIKRSEIVRLLDRV